jgi:hypothetical protein
MATHNWHHEAARNGWLQFGEHCNMEKSSPSETRQEPRTEQRVHGEAQEQPHTGEGAASALARILSQDRKTRRLVGEGEQPATLGGRA